MLKFLKLHRFDTASFCRQWWWVCLLVLTGLLVWGQFGIPFLLRQPWAHALLVLGLTIVAGYWPEPDVDGTDGMLYLDAALPFSVLGASTALLLFTLRVSAPLLMGSLRPGEIAEIPEWVFTCLGIATLWLGSIAIYLFRSSESCEASYVEQRDRGDLDEGFARAVRSLTGDDPSEELQRNFSEVCRLLTGRKD
jgi:hypothetical protein